MKDQPFLSRCMTSIAALLVAAMPQSPTDAPAERPHGGRQAGVRSSVQAADLVVYDDTLQPPWSDASWNTIVSYGNTEQVRSGTSSIKVVLSVAWGFLSMHHGEWNSAGIDPDLYESVDFDIYTSMSETSITVFFENDQGQTFPRINAGTPVEQTWVTVSLPMSQLNPNGYTVHRVCLQEFSGTIRSFYIDNLRFVAAGGANAPAPPVPAWPDDSATGVSLSPTLRWHPSIGADQYRLQVSASNVFNTSVVDEPAVADTQLAVSGLANSTTYYWRLNSQNEAGTSGWSQVRSFKTVPGLPDAPTLASPPDGAINQDTALVLRWNQVPGADSYRLQVATTSDFYTPLVDEQLIPSSSRQVDGLSASTNYFWRVHAKNSAGTSGWSGAWSFVTAPPDAGAGVLILQTSISFPVRSQPSEYREEDYKIVGLPGASNVPVRTILHGSPGRDWQMYWDNGAATDYMMPYENGPEFVFRPGRAFWLIKTTPWEIDVTVPACSLTADREVLLEIHDGWNLITNPFLNPVSWQPVQSLNSTNELIYEFAAGTFSTAGAMEPFKGYYFYNSTNADTLRVKLEPGSRGPTADPTERSGPVDPVGWRIDVRLSSGAYADTALWLGVRKGARDGMDEFDVRKPRRARSVISTSFHRPAWDPLHAYFATDIRDPGTQVHTWTFQVSAAAGGSAELNFGGVERVPVDLAVILIDPHTKATVDVRATPRYQFRTPKHDITMALMIGERDSLASYLSETIAPAAFDLEANYPNPFNSTTIIPFELERDSRLTLKVHNALGQEITTLAGGTLARGRHVVEWNGRDPGGRAVPSGVYFYTLRIEGGPTLTRQMVLVK